MIKQWEPLYKFYKGEESERSAFILIQFKDLLTKLKTPMVGYFMERFDELNLLYENNIT